MKFIRHWISVIGVYFSITLIFMIITAAAAGIYKACSFTWNLIV